MMNVLTYPCWDLRTQASDEYMFKLSLVAKIFKNDTVKKIDG